MGDDKKKKKKKFKTAKAKKNSKPKAKTKPRSKPAAAAASGIATAILRVEDIEKRIGVPHEIQDVMDRLSAKGKRARTTSARVLASFPELKEDVTVQVAVTDLIFDLDSEATTAMLTRVYEKGSTTDIASSSKPHGVLPRQVAGSTVTVVMETLGDPGKLGKFNVQGALQSHISLLAENSPSLKPLIVSEP